MRITKKAVSLVLAMLMITSLFTIVPMTASAAPPTDTGSGTGTGGSTAVINPTTAGDYLTFTAEEAGSTVTLNVRYGSNFKYNKNNSGWQSYTAGTTITLANVGDYVRFSGKDTEFNDTKHVSLTGKVAASGSVMSLRLDNNGESQGLINYCFQYMFYNCAGLTTAPELPETTLAKYCYGAMFGGCTSLTKAPDLPATNLAESCYRYMFRGCENLTELPALPATTLADQCYGYMFYDCSNIRISNQAGTFDGITYSVPYRIPTTGTGTVTPGDDPLDDMFSNTGGKFTGTPNINTTYYLPAPAPATHTITWNNYDNSFITSDEVEEGETPSYGGATPTKTDDSNNIYTFSGWTPEITAVTGDATYTATFTSTPAVAKIGSTKYETFAEAVAGRASNDDVIELLAAAGSYTMTAGQSIKVIKNSKSLTLNAPAGAYAVANTYDSTTKVYTYTAIEAVASATKNDTTTYYASANEALRDAATGSTITLLKDSTETAISRVGSKTSGKTYTIDLNNKTLTLNGSGNALFNIASPSNVTIQNGTIVFDGTGTNQNGILLNDVYNNAVLTIEDDVVIEATGTCSAITVTGGTLNTEGALSSENAPAIDTTNNSSATEYTINVTGGSVTSDNSSAICQRVATGELNITGGNISGGTVAVEAINNTDDTVTVSGGTFNTPVPEEYCADGYIPKDNGNNTYGVKVGSYIAQVGSTKYESLQDALDNVPDGGTVTVLQNISNAGTLYADGYVLGGNRTYTVDLGGYTVSGASFSVADGNDVTFTNGTITSASVAIQNAATTTVDTSATVISTVANNAAVYGLTGSNTIINGTVEGNKYGVFLAGTANGTINGSVSGTSRGLYVKGTGTVNVTGTINSGDRGVTVENGATVNLNNGADVTAPYGVVALKDATVNVNVGSEITSSIHAISGNGTSGDGGYEININGGTITATGDQAAIYHPNTGELNISGGTIASDTASAIVVKSGSTEITGGTITSEGGEAVKYDETGSGYAPFEEIVVSGGTFSSAVPEEYAAPGFVPTPKNPVTGMYTVEVDNSSPLNPLNVAATSINDNNAFGLTDVDYLMGTLLGVQAKSKAGEGTSSQEGTYNMRFVACLDTEILQSAEDYGFVIAKLDDTKDYSNTKIDNLKAFWGNGEKTVSAKNTKNNVCGSEAYGDPDDNSTDYKYITCAINDVSTTDKFLVRFYVQIDGKYYYAKYSGHDYKYTGCIASWSDVFE